MRLLPFLLALCLAPARAAGPGPSYITAVQNAPHNFPGGEAAMEESFRALRAMVKLAGEKNVRLTLLFSAQYAAFVATDTARLGEALAWARDGHEFGAFHQGPETRAWDGYSDLDADRLAKLRPGAVRAGGHAEFLKELARLEPAPRVACTQGSTDKKFLAALPVRELCLGPGKGAEAGANDVIRLSDEPPARRLGSYRPSGRAGVEEAKRAFAGMDTGVYAAMFRSAPADFGAFYAWLGFLSKRDPQGLRSRTATAAFAAGLPEEKAAAKRGGGESGKPESALPVQPLPQPAQQPSQQERPKLKPVRPFFGQPPSGRGTVVRPGYCGDGVCDVFERGLPGSCRKDCGN